MPRPSDVSAFFCVLWDTLFPDEPRDRVAIDDVVENNDVMEINEISG